jgi:glycosyltransferase involved in cell wall biosynthesis
MLDEWALSQSRWKKRIYSSLIEFPGLSHSSCLRAMTRNEALQYRRFGLKNPIAVIPNGVHIPDRITPDAFFEKYPQLREKRVLLFLGRLHTKKGLFPLCEAWKDLAARFPDAHLMIAGPDFEGIIPALRGALEGSPVASFTFPGILNGELKWSALAAAALFLLPSFSEGFSVAILEALGSGTPVVITEKCYFPEAVEAGAAFLTRPDAAAISETLSAALRESESVLHAMGERGAELIRTRYSWPEVADQLAAVYDWTRGASAPAPLPFLMPAET